MRILDATCGTRIMWENKHDPDTVYLDVRPEVKPDIIGSICNTPFANNTFDLVIFDPPHKNLGATSTMTWRYGHFSTAQIMYTLVAGFHEISRILKEDGLCLFKWSDGNIDLNRALRQQPLNLSVLVIQRVSYHTKSGNQCYWVTMIKRSERRLV